MTYEELQQMPILILKGYGHNVNLSLKQFIEILLTELFEKYPSCTEDGQEYTNAGKKRSLVDIYRVCKKFYPETTPQEIREVLYSFEDLVGHYCSTIKRRIYKLRRAVRCSHWFAYGKDDLDEFGEKISYPSTPSEYRKESDSWNFTYASYFTS